ncbi:MAG: excinuclease ABC subunit UvrB [Candidatus Nomurabacteria bacterium]|nr:excinuclease ABC subunit UvrB [Candidatus Nomurabacteria bacterium]
MIHMFDLVSKYQPAGDQPKAIAALGKGLNLYREQTLLGVTGSGKTFTMANVIKNYGRPTLVLAHNKTLAAQLFAEFKEFFPNNAVHYFVSYFDYYQPEAYIAASDTYIEKDSAINDEIEKMRHAATAALLTREDVIVVASVSCIYGIGDPSDYQDMSLLLKVGDERPVQWLVRFLTNILYHRNDIDFKRGTFRVKGDVVDIFPAGEERAIRIELNFDKIERLTLIDPLTGKTVAEQSEIFLFPNSHYATPKEKTLAAITRIQEEFKDRHAYFLQQGRHLEAERLAQRTKYDLEMLSETGFVKGIENYSRHLSGRDEGVPPSTLIDYFPDDFLLIVDESHMTLPQVRGMHNGDRARKQNLVDYGFRLPSALDNRPLKFDEFYQKINKVIFVSATPSEFELGVSPDPVQQVVRPTGLLDPEIIVRPIRNQVDDLVEEIDKRVAKGERVLVTTLTKKMAEDLTIYLQELKVKTAYLHSDVATLERSDILRDLRAGVYDVLVGINLLREGLDLPEVSLVAILDADKEGFLRSESALIQTIGRAARHLNGQVLMYADNITDSMAKAISETEKRRAIQQKYNEEHGITPEGISKNISEGLRAVAPKKNEPTKLDLKKVPKSEIKEIIHELTGQMQMAAAELRFEDATKLRDQIRDLESHT